MRRLGVFALWFGLLFTCLSAANVYRLYFIDRDIWWTPEALAMTPSEGASKVAVLVRGERIERLLQAERLAVVSASGPAVVAPGEVRLRLNNYESVVASRAPALLVAGAGMGGGLVAFAVGLIALAAKRPVDA